MQMNGYIAGPFQVVLGTHQFSVEIYVAPIEEEMLLGLDFLEANGVSLHLKEKKLQIAGEVIPMSLGAGSPLVNEKETGVSLVKGCKVHPNSVMRVGAQLSETLGGEYIVKAATKGEILIPRTLHKGGDNPVRCFIGKNQRSWDQYLPQLAGALKASVNRSTGYTPNMMMLGREIGLPAELIFVSPGKTGQPEGDQYVGELQTAIEGPTGG